MELSFKILLMIKSRFILQEGSVVIASSLSNSCQHSLFTDMKNSFSDDIKFLNPSFFFAEVNKSELEKLGNLENDRYVNI